MMMREVVEGLGGGTGIGVEGDAILASTEEVLESMDRSFAVLSVRCIGIKHKEGKDMSNIGMSTSC